ISLAALTGTLSAEPQTNTAQISGSIKDTSGALLPGASVVAVHSGTGFRSEQLTDGAGNFLLTNLPVGDYSVSAELQAFKRTTQVSITLLIGQTAKLDFTLEVGLVTEEVLVTATEAPLLAANAEVSEIIENARIVNLPLNGRQFMDLSLLSDGVVKPPAG